MPTYEYICGRCDEKFEVVKPMSKFDSVERCPKCDTPSVRQIGSGSGIIFKGDGFYQTDYKNKGL